MQLGFASPRLAWADHGCATDMPDASHLQSCREQQRYRDRHKQETELIKLANSTLAPVRARLVSLKSKTIAKIMFRNGYQGFVRALWLDFEGHEVN